MRVYVTAALEFGAIGSFRLWVPPPLVADLSSINSFYIMHAIPPLNCAIMILAFIVAIIVYSILTRSGLGRLHVYLSDLGL